MLSAGADSIRSRREFLRQPVNRSLSNLCYKGGMQRRAGFTLLEMSIVLAIIAVVMGSGLAMFSASLDRRQLQETNTKLAALRNAILNYRIIYNRLPCPADLTLAYASNYFGVEAPNTNGVTNNCTTGASYHIGTGVRGATGTLPTANFFNTSVHYLVVGMVPARTLGLPDDYAVDGWGRRIVYAVDMRFTVTNAFTSITIASLPNPSSQPWLTISASASGPTKTTLAAYVLVSSGPNGHGGWPRNFSGTIARISTGSVNTDELTNCHCDSTATAANLTKVFVQKMPTQNPSNILDSFDDVLVYATRADLRRANE